jgi:hypothetical protein
MLTLPTGNEILDEFLEGEKDYWNEVDDFTIFRITYTYYKEKFCIDDNVCDALFNKQKLHNLFHLMYYDEYLDYLKKSRLNNYWLVMQSRRGLLRWGWVRN